MNESEGFERLLATLADQYGVLVSIVEAAKIFRRKPKGFRYTLSKGTSTFAQSLRAVRIEQGKRVFFLRDDIARIIWDCKKQ